MQPYAGAMLAPRCEEDSHEAVIGELGRRGIGAVEGYLIPAPRPMARSLSRCIAIAPSSIASPA